MKRAIQSVVLISVIALATLRLTSAFFSDTETSANNTLASGAIDLKIDNTSYYNGVLNEGTTWTPNDLDPTRLFFNFTDIKPGDWGEDTISIRVKDNDAWACMDISLTKDDDKTCTEPEISDDPSCTEPNNNPFDGEIGGLVEFVFWADDGDNVLEDDEASDVVLAKGTAKDVLDGFSIPLADSLRSNVIGIPDGSPLVGGETYYIGKAWCFGTLTLSPVPQGQGVNPTVDGGVDCDGAGLNNASQTDILTADVSFTAVQSRNNPNFLCDDNGGPGPCEKKPDVMLVLDRSGSINSSELATLKTAAKGFVDALSPAADEAHVGMVSFSDTATLNNHLTDDGGALKAGIDALTSGGFTNLYEGILKADDELGNPGDGHDRADGSSPDFMVIITDGAPNRPLPANTADDLAATAADDARAHGIQVYVVGVGVNPATETYLKTEIADDAAHYFSVADFGSLSAILDKIANCPKRE